VSNDSITLLYVDRGDIFIDASGGLDRYVIGGEATRAVASLQGIRTLIANATHLFLGDGKLIRRVARP
jgi:hypothetical protein